MKPHDSFGFRMTLLAVGSGAAALVSAVLLAGCAGDSSHESLPADSTSPVATAAPHGESAPSVPPPVSPARSDGDGSLRPAPSPDEAKAALLEGTRLFDQGEYAMAGARLTVAAAGQPDNARTHYLLGLALWKNGRAAEAERELTRSAGLDETSVKTWINLARVRLDRSDDTAALEAAGKACELSPDSPDALHQKGRALGRLGRTEEAIETLTHALALAPANGYVANSLGNTLLLAGRPADAVPSLEQARDRLPHVAYVRNNLAVAYERTGRREQAIAEYQAAVECGDSNGKAEASLSRLGAPLAPTTDETPGVASAPQPAPGKEPEKTVTTGPGGPAAPSDPDTDGTAGGAH